MGNRFIDHWKSKEPEYTDSSITSKITSVAKPPETVKDKINTAIQRLDVQTKSLDCAVKRFESRDAAMFQSVVKAIANRDKARANILATELWQIRKVEKMLMQESLALESVCMRLRTVSEMGDVVSALGPAASVLNNIRSDMGNIMPEASQELESIGSLLADIVSSSNQSSEPTMNVGAVNADAQQILQEAELAAEKRLREQFPEATTAVNTSKKTSIEI